MFEFNSDRPPELVLLEEVIYDGPLSEDKEGEHLLTSAFLVSVFSTFHLIFDWPPISAGL